MARILLMGLPFYKFMGSHNNDPRLGLGYLSAILRKAGHEVKQYNPDYGTEFATQKELFERSGDFLKDVATPYHPIYVETFKVIDKFEPDIVGFSILAGTVIQSEIIAKYCSNQDIRTIAGGPMVTLGLDQFINNTDYAQLVPGESETVIKRVIDHPERKVVVGVPINNINHLPYVDRDNFINDTSNMFYGSVITTRGCPFKCKFCFPPETEIQTSLGFKHIKDIELGDMVLDHEKNYNKVTRIFKRSYAGFLVVVNVDNGHTWIPGRDNRRKIGFRATPEHEILTYYNGWKKAMDLTISDRLMTPSNVFDINVPIKEISQKWYEGPVYNLEVENSHTYTAEGFAVHNCAHWLAGGEIRYRTPTNVMGELKRIVDTYGQKYFRFFDETFTMNKPRIFKLCEAIKEEKLDIEFLVETRVDCLDEEMILALKEAGMVRAKLGVESGSPRILKLYKKGVTVEKVRNVVGLLDKHDIDVNINWMYGFEEETDDDLRKSIDLALELGASWNTISCLSPYYGTDLYDNLPDAQQKKWKCFYHNMKVPPLNPELSMDLINEFLSVNDHKRWVKE